MSLVNLDEHIADKLAALEGNNQKAAQLSLMFKELSGDALLIARDAIPKKFAELKSDEKQPKVKDFRKIIRDAKKGIWFKEKKKKTEVKEMSLLEKMNITPNSKVIIVANNNYEIQLPEYFKNLAMVCGYGKLNTMTSFPEGYKYLITTYRGDKIPFSLVSKAKNDKSFIIQSFNDNSELQQFVNKLSEGALIERLDSPQQTQATSETNQNTDNNAIELTDSLQKFLDEQNYQDHLNEKSTPTIQIIVKELFRRRGVDFMNQTVSRSDRKMVIDFMNSIGFHKFDDTAYYNTLNSLKKPDSNKSATSKPSSGNDSEQLTQMALAEKFFDENYEGKVPNPATGAVVDKFMQYLKFNGKPVTSRPAASNLIGAVRKKRGVTPSKVGVQSTDNKPSSPATSHIEPPAEETSSSAQTKTVVEPEAETQFPSNNETTKTSDAVDTSSVRPENEEEALVEEEEVTTPKVSEQLIPSPASHHQQEESTSSGYNERIVEEHMAKLLKGDKFLRFAYLSNHPLIKEFLLLASDDEVIQKQQQSVDLGNFLNNKK